MTTPMIEFEAVVCPLCNSADSQELLLNSDYGERVSGVFRLVRCHGCGLRYQSPRPTPATISSCYPDHYSAYASVSLRTRRGLLGWLTRRGMRQRLTLLDQAIPPQAGQVRQLLDVGSGAGVFLEAAQLYGGWQLQGLEPNARAATATSSRIGVPIFNGTLAQACYPTASIDVATLWDVLEHVHQPLEDLRELRRIIRPDGAVFIRVPNAASFTRLAAGRYWAGYDLPRHITVFDPATLRSALRAAGFSRIIAEYTSGSYLYLFHSLRFAMSDHPRLERYAASTHRLLFHPIARGICGIPLALADRLGQGAALEILARLD